MLALFMHEPNSIFNHHAERISYFMKHLMNCHKDLFLFLCRITSMMLIIWLSEKDLYIWIITFLIRHVFQRSSDIWWKPKSLLLVCFGAPSGGWTVCLNNLRWTSSFLKFKFIVFRIITGKSNGIKKKCEIRLLCSDLNFLFMRLS